MTSNRTPVEPTDPALIVSTGEPALQPETILGLAFGAAMVLQGYSGKQAAEMVRAANRPAQLVKGSANAKR